MRETETIIVGGGPAGSSCARALIRAGRDCLVLEKEAMPRVKLCAGWITPKVLKDLAIDPTEYPHGILKLNQFKISLGAKHRIFHLPTKQFSIRRVEFDHWLLQRAGAEVVPHPVKGIERNGSQFIIDKKFTCRFLVGAGGSNCPVRKTFFGEHGGKKVLTKEIEYPTAKKLGAACTLWIPFAGKGYAWAVQKAGAVNIGYGGLASGMNPSEMPYHWKKFIALLENSGNSNDEEHPPTSWFYFLNRPWKKITVKKNRAYIVGDAVGLATMDLGEGIGPAVESGILAARDILGTEEYFTSKITAFSIPGLLPYLPGFLLRPLLRFAFAG
jgi:flavin-dependent dehydrogenase